MTIALTDARRAALRATLAGHWVLWLGGLALVLLVGNLVLHDTLFHRGTPATTAAPSAAAAEATPPNVPKMLFTCTLPVGKYRAAGITTEPAELVSLPTELGVPGRIEANLDHQVQVRPRAAGVVRDVHVVLGQNVKKGEVLAVLDSPDIGTARLDLRARQRELHTARIEADWKKQVAANVESLIPELRRRVEAANIQKAYADRPLGTFRATLLEAYSKYDIAEHEEKKTAGLYQEQILGEHMAFVTKHTREGSQAVFDGAMEQAKFDANLQRVVAEQKVRQAEANVIDAAERLRILGVPENIKEVLDRAAQVAAASAESVGKDVTVYPILAPFDGKLLTKNAVLSQPVDTKDVLFTLADLSTVWVMADIPESDFGLLPALNQGKIKLTATAYPGRSFAAKVLSVAATVDPTTRTVAMLAETPNPEGLLKVGLFVRITLDTSVDSQVLCVPTAAVVEIEGQKGVFVPGGQDGRTFTFHPVKLGRESGERQVVRSGLARGDAVVSRGAFTLKSELVLRSGSGDE